MLISCKIGLDLAKAQDAEGNIDESFVVKEKRSDMLVFGAENPYPKVAARPNTLVPIEGRIPTS